MFMFCNLSKNEINKKLRFKYNSFPYVFFFEVFLYFIIITTHIIYK